MKRRILLILSHSIEEHDQVKLFSREGHDVFSLGGYIDPRHPHDPKRPALEWADFAERAALQAVVDGQGVEDNIGTAAARIPGEILEWLGDDGVIIAHHYLERIYGQWNHLAPWMKKGGRVIWRTVGQSATDNELRASEFVRQGLEIVRYSPKEKCIPGYAGCDALIRFYKDPAEWGDWNGEIDAIANITQDMLRREVWCNAHFYLTATRSLDARPAGPGSERLPGGLGELEFEEMKGYLRDLRVYLYCGTQPASYTLGLIEALMTGIPVVSIGPAAMQIFPWGHELFEGHELSYFWENDPHLVGDALDVFLEDHKLAGQVGQHLRHRTIQEFGIDKVAADWKAYLG